MANVLITGGTGLLGRYLRNILGNNGYKVSVLSRVSNINENVYAWDINNKTIDKKAIETADYIIHLAGAGVTDQRWTKARKKEIINSRVESTLLIADALKNSNHHVKSVVCASAIGFYGSDTGHRVIEENAPAGTDFLAQLTNQWEEAEETLLETGVRLIKLRIGVVLSPEGGALPKMAAPVKMGIGTVLGSGNQYISWIHIHDLCQMFIRSLEDDSMSGVYNATAPNPVTNREFIYGIARYLQKRIYFPPVPSLFLRFALGEMSLMVTGGNNISCKRILSTGYEFRFRTLDQALQDLLPLPN